VGYSPDREGVVYMKVGIVRGSNLNPYEMQSYEPLMGEYEITGFCSYRNNYEINTIRFPIKNCILLKSFTSGYPGPPAHLPMEHYFHMA